MMVYTIKLLVLGILLGAEAHLEAVSARLGRCLVATPVHSAGEVLRRDGVVRVDSVIDSDFAADLKLQILRDHSHYYDGSAVVLRDRDEVIDTDKRHIPGTRLRFDRQVAAPFAGMRADILLPIENMQVKQFLRQATGTLSDVLKTGSKRLPQHEKKHEHLSLELVECAALVAWPGANHQTIHADYTPGSPLPPRLVAFVYLQDLPACIHGATVFYPGTTATSPKKPTATSARLSTKVSAGDAIIYDASLFHFGAANTVPQNERVVAYFGSARSQAAIAASSSSSVKQNQRQDRSGPTATENSLIEHPPILIDSLCR